METFHQNIVLNRSENQFINKFFFFYEGKNNFKALSIKIFLNTLINTSKGKFQSINLSKELYRTP